MLRVPHRMMALVALAASLSVFAGSAAPVPGATSLASVSSSGDQGNQDSCCPTVSADGRFVAFASDASNLVPGDTNGRKDIFVHDRQTGATARVSVDSAGGQANGDSSVPAISADGRFVAFASEASNLVPGDTNGQRDIFVRDREDGTTQRVSVSTAGAQGFWWQDSPAISADGRFVAFVSASFNLVPGDTNWTTDIFVRDREGGITERVSIDSDERQANGESSGLAVSADGRFVAFVSAANNLVPSDTNGGKDIFVRDREGGITERVSVDSAGAQANSDSGDAKISADGRFVAFSSTASNLVPSDGNGQLDVFVHDRHTGETQLVSLGATGTQGNGWSEYPIISADGRHVVFQSLATNLVPADTNGVSDIFLRDRQLGSTERVSVDGAGLQAGSWSKHPTISVDGRVIAFASLAANLVPGDANGAWDVFVQDRQGIVPAVEAGQPATITEGSAFTGAGYFVDPDSDSWTATVDYGDGSGPQPLTLVGKTFLLDHAYADDGVYTVTVTVADFGDTGSDTTTVTVLNLPPSVASITTATEPIQVGTVLTARAQITDPGILDTHSGLWHWGDGSSSAGAVTEVGDVRWVTASHTYTAPGLYAISLAVTDDDGGVGTAVYKYIVVYDPDGPFVTGGGWIDSPAGGYPADPALTGRASFSLTADYKKGATVPTGRAEFHFPAAGLRFHADRLEWLVVTPDRVYLRGTGQVNGEGQYGFMLAGTTVDGNGTSIWIKIWQSDDPSSVRYDNMPGANELVAPGTMIGGGGIAVHR